MERTVRMHEYIYSYVAVRGAPCDEGPGERAEAQDRGRRGGGGGAGRRRLRVPRAPRAEGGPLRDQAAGAGAQPQGAARLLLQLKLIRSIDAYADADHADGRSNECISINSILWTAVRTYVRTIRACK